ncbi:MAG: DUF4136 domain-containing protein [Bacteroidota bacterium]
MKKIFIVLIMVPMYFTTEAQKKISVVYNRDFDFSSLETFDFSRSAYALSQKFKKQPVVAPVLIENLAKAGVKKVKSEADAIVDVNMSFTKSIKIDKDSRTLHYRYTTTPFPRLRYAGAVNNKPLKVRLWINIIDRQSNQTVWTGVWLGEPDLNIPPDKRNKKVEKIIRKMFKKYPVK